jgi:hypothetical protein
VVGKSVGQFQSFNFRKPFFIRGYFAEPQSSIGNAVLGGDAPLCNRFGFDARRPCCCRCNSFPGREGFISLDDRSICGFCSSLWTGLPVESRPDLSTFRNQSTKPLEISGFRRDSVGCSLSPLVVAGPPACEVKDKWNDTVTSID